MPERGADRVPRVVRQPGNLIRTDYPDSLWVQARTVIANLIAVGDLAPGTRLPPERALCDDLQVSRVTLRRALSSLHEDGLISASHGRGWFVTTGQAAAEWPNSLESFTETARRLGLESSSRVIRCERVPATLDDAERMGVAPGTLLFVLDRVRLLGGVPVAVDHARLPTGIVPDPSAVDFRQASLYGWLTEAGVEPSRAESTIEARRPHPVTADLLGLAPDAPVLVMHQAVVTADGRTVLLSDIEYSGDRYRLRTVFSRGPG